MEEGDYMEIRMEEERNLKSSYSKLLNYIEHLESRKDYSVGKYSVSSDYENLDDLHFKKNKNQRIENRIKELKKCMKNIYYGRIDLELEDDVNSYYIGEKLISLDKEVLVYDWRSDLGNYYYSSFNANNKYDLVLKRQLEIDYDELINYYDDYNKNGEDGEILDPYLQKILMQNRKTYQIQDIIKTIQSKQNEIIRWNPKESFILNGCAGSGKTMIILHRLSQLVYNKEYKLDDLLIISPSNLIDNSMSDLIKKLELTNIEVLPIKDKLLKIYKDYKKTYNLKEVNKDKIKYVKDIGNIVESKDFFIDFKNNYYNYMDRLSECFLRDYYIEDIEEKLDIKSERPLDINSYKGLKKYRDYMDYLLINDSNNSQKIQKLKGVLNDIKIEENLDLDSFKIKNEEILKLLETEKSSILKEISSKSKLHIFDKFNIKFNLDFDMGYGDILIIIDGILQNLMDEEDIIRTSLDRLSKEVKNRNIEKRNKDIENERSNLCRENKSVENKITSLRLNDFEGNKEEISTLEEKRTYLLNRIEELYMQIQDGIVEDQEDKDKIKTYKKEIQLIRNVRIDIDDNLNKFKLAYKASKEKIQSNNKIINKFKNLKDNYETSRLELNSLSKKKLSELEISLLEDIKDFIDKIDIEKIFIDIYRRTLENYNIYSSIYNQYYLSYYKLLLSFYYGNQVSSNRLISIDEAQDLKYFEWDTIKNYYGNLGIFNIYGDYLQKTDLNAIESLEDFGIEKCFVLKENYRNSREMVAYINDKFGLGILGLGLSLEPVSKISKNEFMEKVSQGVNQDSLGNYERLAFIYKDQSDLEGLDLSLLGPKLKILRVDYVKGMEFERVFVLDKNMNKAERYIAYTRALNYLYIVN